MTRLLPDPLYTDNRLEGPDPWWCDDCGAEDSPSNCTCESPTQAAPTPPPFDEQEF
jgi:hypothetical protein